MAPAQEQPNPFLLLKPWLEKRFGAREPARAETEAPADAATTGDAVNPSAPTAGQAATNAAEQAATDAAAAPAQAAPSTTNATPEGLPLATGATAPASISERVRTELDPNALRAEQPEGAPADSPTQDTAAAPSIDATGEMPPAVESVEPDTRRAEPREEAPQPLRLAVLAGRDPSAILRALLPVSESLAAEIGRPVEFLPVATFGAMIDAQVQRRIDGGFYSAAAFAVAEEECRCLEPLVAAASGDGTAAYHAIIVTRRGSGIDSVDDLAGRTVATGSADSIGSRRMQLAGLLAEGADPGDYRLRMVQSAEQAVRLVLEGSAAAAFAWSSLEGDREAGYSRGTLSDMVARGEMVMNDVEVIWRSAPVAHGPFAVLRTLADEEKSALEDYLLDLEEMEPVAYDRLNPLYEGGYVAVEPENYAGLAVLATQEVDAVQPRPDPRPAAGR
jgi:phosphonate transport system substrate-binding protein